MVMLLASIAPLYAGYNVYLRVRLQRIRQMYSRPLCLIRLPLIS